MANPSGRSGRAWEVPGTEQQTHTMGARGAAPVMDMKTLALLVIEGPDAGRTFVLPADRVLVGTSPACAFRLADGTVSRRHLALEPAGVRIRVMDLGSTNGTYVDGIAVTDAFLRGGEVIRCGSTAFRVEPKVTPAESPLGSAMRFGTTIGASPAMRRIYPLCERLAKARIPVLIEGETGTGKEVLAESLHQESGLSGPFVVFDCTAVSPSIVEAELFGHERGAFTGADKARPGVFEQAHGGTLFIDEIGDLDLHLQPKLLRAIDRSEIRRVGGQKTIAVNTRILAATRRNLDKEVEAGRFRDDLFHRLAVGRVELPPLRRREGDAALLCRYFTRAMGGDEASATLPGFDGYAWPGNVRELKNAIARRIALGDQALAAEVPQDTGADVAAAGTSQRDVAGMDAWIDKLVTEGMPYPIARRRMLEEFERAFVTKVLDMHDGNVSKAAEASGIARRYFHMIKSRSSPTK
ncbi:MAG: sigma 54-dependent Fis family transcriptional regulator [Polyangiaceae bacterium]|nr:sigma 54-dependent Fis family transcriptional regulator [Polyangiaceae bacterium]